PNSPFPDFSSSSAHRPTTPVFAHEDLAPAAAQSSSRSAAAAAKLLAATVRQCSSRSSIDKYLHPLL
ncbi:hypothetical protein F443_19800, partial [Phytophthora nicotianae P1569]